ncbi:hypothetical protein C8J57DRAFT_1340558, partial [Mycena rebaudengoi]
MPPLQLRSIHQPLCNLHAFLFPGSLLLRTSFARLVLVPATLSFSEDYSFVHSISHFCNLSTFLLLNPPQSASSSLSQLLRPQLHVNPSRKLH